MELKDIELCGTVLEIVYRNDNNGFTIIELQVMESNDADFISENSDLVTTVTGVIPGVNAGETLKVKGFWTNHPDYGLQFKAESFMVEMPASLNGMEKYLGSGLLPGIGAALAKRIITEFGESSFDIIEKEPEKLVKIKGISPKKAEVIHEAFIEQREVTNVVAFFSNLGVATSFALKIYRMYGSGSVGIIKENPYRLCDNIKGIGFKTADSVARAMGFVADSKERKLSAIRYVLNEYHGDGHTCIPFENLINATSELIKSDKLSIEKSLELLLTNGLLAEEVINGERMIYSLSFLRAEEGVALRILSLAGECDGWYEVFESEKKKIENKTASGG